MAKAKTKVNQVKEDKALPVTTTCAECENKQAEIYALSSKLKSANGKIGHLTQIVKNFDEENKKLQQAVVKAEKELKSYKDHYNELSSEHKKTVAMAKQTLTVLSEAKVRFWNFIHLNVFERLWVSLSTKKLRTRLEV